MPSLFAEETPAKTLFPPEDVNDPLLSHPDPLGGIVPAAPAKAPSLFDNLSETPIDPSDYPTWGDQVAAGADSTIAVGLEGANQTAQYFGFSGSKAQKWLDSTAEEYWKDAQAVPAVGLWDNIARGAGSVIAAAPAVAAGGILGAFAGYGGAGMAAAGALTSTSMNLGDKTFKAEALVGEDNAPASGSDMLLSGALGTMDLYVPNRIWSSLKAAKPALEKGFLTAVRESLPDFGKSVSVAGAVEGIQDFATGAKAYTSTETDITPKIVEGLVESAALEAVVGAMLAGPPASIPMIGEVASKMSPQRVKFEVDPEGNNTNFTYDAPVADLSKDGAIMAGVRSGLATVTGNATDKINVAFAKVSPELMSKSWKAIKGKINQGPEHRAEMMANGTYETTQDVDESVLQADLDGPQVGFWKKPAHLSSDEFAQVSEEALVAKTQGLREHANPDVQTALNAIWHTDEATRYYASFFPDLKFRPRGETYVPWVPDNEKIVNDKETFFTEAVQDYIEQGIEAEKAIAKVAAVDGNYINNIEKYGRPMQDTRRSDAIGNAMVEKFAELHTISDPKKRARRARQLNFQMKNDIIPQINKNNPLELDRQLDDHSDAFLQKWAAKMTPQELYRGHNNAVAARIAHVNKWGASNEVYWDLWGNALAEAAEQGIIIPADIQARAVDLINTMQKQPIKNASARTRKVMENIRAFETINKLPLAIIPSLAEMLFITNKYGVVNGFTQIGQGLFENLRHTITGANLPPLRQEMLDSLGASIEKASSVQMSRVANDTFNPKYVEHWFYKNVTFLGQFTETLRIAAAFEAEKAIVQYISDLQSRDIGKVQAAVEFLYEAGINPNEARQWGTDYNNSYFREVIRPATLMLAEDVVIHPTPAKRPLWHGNPNLMLLSHMKGFSTHFTNSVMKTWWNRLTNGTTAEKVVFASKIFPNLVTFVALQASLAGLREWLRTGETEQFDSRNLAEHILTGVQYIGYGGMGVEAIHRAGFGTSVAENMIGSSAGTANQLAKALNKAFTDPAGAINDIMRVAVPNAPGKHIILEAVKLEGLDSGND